jgi:hypothetical protein
MPSATEISLNPYVFIVGSARSGTTLLGPIVKAHPQIAIGLGLLEGSAPTAEEEGAHRSLTYAESARTRERA